MYTYSNQQLNNNRNNHLQMTIRMSDKICILGKAIVLNKNNITYSCVYNNK